MEQEMIDFLVKRAKEEKEKIDSKKRGIMSTFLMSKDDMAKDNEEANKSLAKMEMIGEIITEYHRMTLAKQNEETEIDK